MRCIASTAGKCVRHLDSPGKKRHSEIIREELLTERKRCRPHVFPVLQESFEAPALSAPLSLPIAEVGERPCMKVFPPASGVPPGSIEPWARRAARAPFPCPGVGEIPR